MSVASEERKLALECARGIMRWLCEVDESATAVHGGCRNPEGWEHTYECEALVEIEDRVLAAIRAAKAEGK